MLEPVLNELKKILTEKAWNTGFIAGGYLRDTILNRPTGDIDIFFPRWSSNSPVLKTVDALFDFKEISNKYSTVFKVREGDVLGQKVQLITTGLSMVDMVSSFSVGLCQVYAPLAHPTEITIHVRFEKSVRDKTIYVKMPEDLSVGQQYKMFETLLPKIKKKYDWPIVISNYYGLTYKVD